MKNIALIIASIFLLSTAALAGQGTVNKKTHKKGVTTKAYLAEKFSNILGYPSSILNEENETVMISYSVDSNDIIHIQQISTSNTELEKYILKKLDGKKIKNMQVEGKNGVVKVQFNSMGN